MMMDFEKAVNRIYEEQKWPKTKVEKGSSVLSIDVDKGDGLWWDLRYGSELKPEVAKILEKHADPEGSVVKIFFRWEVETEEKTTDTPGYWQPDFTVTKVIVDGKALDKREADIIAGAFEEEIEHVIETES